MLELSHEQQFLRLGASLALGLLVGLQRERTGSRLAGLRTFPLVTVLGTIAGLVSPIYPAVLPAAWIGFAALVATAHAIEARHANDPGMTTSATLLLMFGVGSMVALGAWPAAIVLGGGTAVLLNLKEELHGFAGRLSDRDARAIMQFALLSLVVLPVLPDRTLGPYDVLNPRQTWWMVVLIVAMSLLGYVAYRLIGARRGSLLGGFLGGLVSSTAATMSFARRSREAPSASTLAATSVVIAAAVVFVRVLIELAIVSPSSLSAAAPRLLVLLVVTSAAAAILWRRGESADVAIPEPSNPSELRPALLFGALYAVVLLAVAAVRESLGDVGLYTVAALSGLTDMDAITLSTARLMETGRLPVETGWRVVVVASIFNLAAKGTIVAVVGSGQLTVRVAGAFGTAIVAGALLLLF